MAEPQASASRKDDPAILVSPSEAGRAADALVAKADARRAAAIGTLELVQRARAEVLSREVERLTAADDARHTVLAQVVEATEETAQQLRLEAERAATPQPAPSDALSKVYGRVLDARLEPVGGATVHVIDSTGKQVRGASATSDGKGYFVLEWKPPARR